MVENRRVRQSMPLTALLRDGDRIAWTGQMQISSEKGRDVLFILHVDRLVEGMETAK